MKLKEKLTYLLICLGAVGVFAFTFCTKKLSCPGFDNTELTSWFPYNNNERLVFQSNSGEQDTSLLINTGTSTPYETSGGFTSPLRCHASKEFESVEKGSGGRTKFSLSLVDSDDFSGAYLWVKDSYIDFRNITDTGFQQVFINSKWSPIQSLASVTLVNRSFTDVKVATRDTSNESKPGIFKVFYSKSKGIVGYTEYPSLKQWAKQ